jgi:hypothetical protein
MQVETRPFAPTTGVRFESDVESLSYLDGNLDVILACSQDEEGTIHGLKVHFAQPSGFRLLDELDLARYWMSKSFARGSHVLEVKNGGWSAEEDVLQSFETKRREWLIVSGNACVSVFCSLEPELMDMSWKYGSRAL